MSKLIHPQGTMEAHELALIFPPMEDGDYKELRKSIREHGLRDDIITLDGKVLDGLNRYCACMDEGIKPTFSPYNVEFDGKEPAEFVMDKNFARRHLSLSQKAAVATKFLVIEEQLARKRQQATQFQPGTGAQPAPAPEAIVAEVVVPGDGPIIADEAPPVLTETSGETSAPAPLVATGTGKGGSIQGKGGAAAALIAEKFGVSRTMVLLAKKIKRNDESLFDDVLNNRKTVNEAMAIIDARLAEQQDTGSKLAAKEARKTALEAIGDAYGLESDVYRKAAGKEILKTPSDLIAFSLMKTKATKSIIPLLGLGWGLEKAKKFLDGKLTTENTIEDFQNIATANGKPAETPFVATIGRWTFTAVLAAE